MQTPFLIHASRNKRKGSDEAKKIQFFNSERNNYFMTGRLKQGGKETKLKLP